MNRATELKERLLRVRIRSGKTVAMVIPLLLLAGVGYALTRGGTVSVVPRKATVSAPPQRCGPDRLPPSPYVGVAPQAPWRTSVSQFTAVTGIVPGVIENYSAFGEPFATARMCSEIRLGSIPLIQLNPFHQGLHAIASGRYDRYLWSYATAVKMFTSPVAISFGHEMNGNWYPWGYSHVTPATFVAAWRHVHQVFSQAGASNAIWVWTVNRDSSRAAVSPDHLWWPGSRYVSWVGINGKYPREIDTFSSVFGASLTSIRALTRKPILLTETGIDTERSRPAQIRNLFRGMTRNPQIIGMVWFNLRATHGNWRLQGDPSSDTEFRQAADLYASPREIQTYREAKDPR